MEENNNAIWMILYTQRQPEDSTHNDEHIVNAVWVGTRQPTNKEWLNEGGRDMNRKFLWKGTTGTIAPNDLNINDGFDGCGYHSVPGIVEPFIDTKEDEDCIIYKKDEDGRIIRNPGFPFDNFGALSIAFTACGTASGRWKRSQ